MTNFDTAREALDTSLNSSGSAMKEHEKWQQSLEAQINKLKASWQGLSQAFLKSDFLKATLDAVIDLVDGVTKLIDTFGAFPTLLGVFAAFKGIPTIFSTISKTVSELGGVGTLKLKSFGDVLSLLQLSFPKTAAGASKLSDAFKNLKSSGGGATGVMSKFKSVLSSGNVYVAAAVIAITALTAVITHQKKEAEELAKEVEELTSKYKEKHDALKDLEGDFDTSNESSMISRYEKLSKGVDNLGKNVSLTSEEYSEYQGIVNSIAERMPSIVSGYNDQGNALLGVKDNVEELVAAYEKLIHVENQDMLANTGDIEQNFANTVKNASDYDLLERFGNLFSFDGAFGGKMEVFDMKLSTVEWLSKLEQGMSEEEISKQIANFHDYGIEEYASQEIAQALQKAGYDSANYYSGVPETLEEILEKEPEKLQAIIDDYYAQFDDVVGQQKAIAAAKLSEAFDVSDVISGVDYGNISEELKTIAYQTVNSLDFKFFEELSNSGKTVEQWTTEMLKQLNSLSDTDNKTIETGFELQTQFNGGDISYGEYVNSLRDVEKTIDGLDLKEEVKEQLKLSLDLDEEGVVDQYDALVNRLTSKDDKLGLGLDEKEAKNFLNSLSVEELAVATKIIPDLDVGTTIAEIQAIIDEQLATEFKFDITGQIKGIEAFNTALAESRSATGLTSESISALKARYEDLDGYNAAALFEKTANGIHLNNDELSRLEEQYVNVNKLNIENNINKLANKYNDLTDEIKNCTDAQEKENLQRQAESYKDKIDELTTLASQYDGLTSSFAKWQTALEGAEEGDNYDSLYENLESIKELYDKGLVGTDKFKTAAQLMTNEDLSDAGIDEIVNAYKKGYPKMQRYFTEGQKGCKNFLKDVQNLNSEWAHMNKDGSWDINFNVDEISKELGVSTDFVLQIAKKLKDYGFEVNFEDASLDNLKTKIEQTEAKLKELGKAPVDINVDIEANTENLGKIESEIEKAKSKIKEINNSSVDAKVKTAQLEDAQAKLEALIDKKQEASQPAFMNLNTSQVNASLVDALEKVKAYQEAINEVNKLSELKEAGITIDDSQLQTAKEKVDECAKAIQGLDGEVKMAIGLEEDGSIDSIKKAFEEGKVKIDADTDPALTKIEQLAENVERIEDKDVAINVTVNGLDQVKELNKQIDLATDIDGDIDKLNDYVKSAQALSGLEDNIASFVTAEVKGSVLDLSGQELENLKAFAGSAKQLKALKDAGSFTSSVKADVSGNVIDTPEYQLNNLKVFTDSAKNLGDIGSVKSEVKAEIKGNVIDEFEYKINNLKVFSDNAKDLHKIGNVEANVKANVEGNVIDEFEYKLNNLKVFTDSAKDISKISNVESNVKTNVEGNVIDEFEYKINNLKVFTDNAKDISKIGNVESKVVANVEGNVINTTEDKIAKLKSFADNAKDIGKIGSITSKVKVDIEGNVVDTFEHKINNLKTFSDSANDLGKVGNIESKVTADIEGNVIDKFEYKINNLKVFADSAKNINKIGDAKVEVEANIGGNVMDESSYKLDNFKVFADSAKNIQDIGTVNSKVTANVDGNVTDEFEYKINNLKVFTDSAEDIKGIGDVASSVTADVSGNVIDTREGKIDNLKVYTDNAEKVGDIGTVTSKVTADIAGNVVDTREGKIDNLKVYTDSAKDIKSVGVVKSSVNANISGNVIDTREGKLDNLKVFGESAKKAKGIGTVNSSVTANINGNVINTLEEKIDNLGVFADNANKLKNTGNFTSSVAANVSGNVVTDDTVVSDLEHFKSVVSGMSNQTVTVSVTAKVDSENVNAAIDLLKKVSDSGVFKDYSATVQVGAKVTKIDDTAVQNYKTPSKDGTVKYRVDPESSVYTWTAPSKDGVVNYDAQVEALTDSQKHKKGTITYDVKISGFPVVNGTANVNGTAFANGTSGKAFRQGDWGVKKTTTALTGELGQELVVYKNRFWTVGDNGAEFATIPKGAIVFNHKQTAELFANGRVTSDGGRGKVLANGTAFAEGTAYNNVTGGGSFYGSSNSDKVTVKADSVNVESKTATTTSKSTSTKNSVTGQTYNKKSSSSSSSDTKDDFEETFDWIEIKISRIERAIDQLDQKANRTYKSWSSRNKALTSEISKVGEEINLQSKAYDKYMAAANAVGLSSKWKNKVKNGSIDISTIKDEALAEKIKSFQDYYEKALECKDAIENLKDTEAELYAQRFENIQTQYDGILQGYEHTEAMLNEYISQAEEQGYLVSTKYYNALINNEKQNIAELKKKQSALIKARDEAVASGKIAKNSEEWISMCNEIDGVTQAIEESTTALLEFDNAMRDIDWQVFDLVQERISDITAESEFLIELMSNKDLFDDNGKFTEQGVATVGLHALNYNSSMYAVDDYQNEINKLDKQMAKDPYDQELINRRRELAEAMREQILAAEDCKDSIKSLLEEGYEKELDALSERIDKYNESIDAAKKLFDYQKDVQKQSEEIASLEKQRAAYLNDNSEFGKSKLQEITVSLQEAREDLQETEYDKYISDQTALLDTLYTEYETILNSRLDNVDYWLEQVVDGINAAAGVEGTITSALGADGAIAVALGSNATTIGETLKTEVGAVGTKLSTAMSSIWIGDGSGKAVIDLYGKDFQSKQTTTNEALNSIKANVNAMVDDIDKDAQKKVAANKTTTSAKKDPTKTTTTTSKTNKTTTTTKKTTTTKSTGDGKAKVGDKVKFVSGQYYYDSQGKKPLGSHNLGKQVYITSINNKSWATHPYHISTGKKLGSGDLGWLKLNQLSGYASGKKRISNSQYAWTQENGQEYIVRPSDGAILTPIAKGDSVLNATASGNIWQMANNPAEFIKNNLGLDAANVPNGSNIQNSYIQNFENITFSMPNVHSYNEMLMQMQKDPKFDKLIKAMTIDQIAGKSSLAKGKSIR